jgi:heme-degrading monooxygenase HmoA
MTTLESRHQGRGYPEGELATGSRRWIVSTVSFRRCLMIGVFVNFDYDDEIDRERLVDVAAKASPAFEGMPGLRLKVFTIDEANKRATNVYVWESEDAAKAFFSDELTERVTGLYGVRPRIEFVEIAALVDNTAGVAVA